MVEVVRGLSPGDTVLLGSSQELAEGTSVRIQGDEGAAAPVAAPLESGNREK
jgi:hypothetical protein